MSLQSASNFTLDATTTNIKDLKQTLMVTAKRKWQNKRSCEKNNSSAQMVHFKTLHISLTASAKEDCKITKFSIF